MIHPHQPQRITRNQVIVGLLITTMLAACAAPAVDSDSSSGPEQAASDRTAVPSSQTGAAGAGNAGAGNAAAGNAAAGNAANVSSANLNTANGDKAEIEFTDLQSCKMETERLGAEYKILKEAFDAGKLQGSAPIQPTLQPDECEAFLAAAKQQYAAQAPTYADQTACEASGDPCERVEPSRDNNYIQPIYRPIFFGGYSYNPWLPPVYIGSQRDYGSHTTVIYRDSSTSNSNGSSNSNTGGSRTPTSTSAPKPTAKSTTSPSRPTATQTPTKPAQKSGSNAITGRGTSGFGSSYKSTGKGGK